jgi:hypothetical protein
MSIIFKPLQILYRGESQRNSHFPRLVLVLATDWLGRWKATVHMIRKPVTNVGVRFTTFNLPLFLKSIPILWYEGDTPTVIRGRLNNLKYSG